MFQEDGRVYLLVFCSIDTYPSLRSMGLGPYLLFPSLQVLWFLPSLSK